MSRCLPQIERGCVCCDLVFCCAFQGCYCTLQSVLGVALGVFVVANASYPPPYLDAGILVGVAYIFISTLAATASILFLIGISKRRAYLLRPYVVLLYFTVAGSAVALYLTAERKEIGALAVDLIYLGTHCYMLLCANSLLLKMEEESHMDISQTEPLKGGLIFTA
ncbi:hypothetical protein ONE63_003373 [Megalurothrips usitatus]|uniref:MARVEL domain-containing protein n=1 Tax=Megalurothrips usitatus TaxID=439358 RepID=A0AAV7XDP0_9NEOP|nr:hypothetical protein ONE63_003373 [Megalurothrips usitatus]KAJ1521737.1 hypothetical protein ONE63_003373 [Megalurothrips usitatus]